MGTFILAFIGNGFVRSAQRLTEGATMLEPLPPTWQRRLFVVVYFAAIVSCVTLFGVMVRQGLTPPAGPGSAPRGGPLAVCLRRALNAVPWRRRFRTSSGRAPTL